MNPIRFPLVVFAALLLACCGATQVLNKAPDEILKSKGLTKVGFTYLLQGDIQLPAGLRAMRLGKRKLDAAITKREKLEREILNAENAIAVGEEQNRDLTAQMERSKGVPVAYNRLVDQVNAVRGQLRAADRYEKACQDELGKLVDPRDDYVAAVVDLSDRMEADAARYQALAADKEVAETLVLINQTSRAKIKLGPSTAFSTELQPVRNLRKMINSSAIKFSIKHGVPEVEVTLNGEVSQPMVLDSGAATVLLSWEVAHRLGMTPGPNDPAIPMVIAGGKKLEARVMTIDSVRLGPFTVEKVVCAVLPEDMKDADCLLGGTFLRNFVYKTDLAAGVLHMSQISGAVKPGDLKTQFIPTQVIVEKGWTVLFRSADPARWNTDFHDSRSYAVPSDKAPRKMRYLRMRNAGGEYVIIPLTFGELRREVIREKDGWEGRDYDSNQAHHLGIFVKSFPRTDTGSIDIAQYNGAGGTGYGFGNRVNRDDRQGYAWDGKPVDEEVFEIAVTDHDLTAAERERLVSR
jgi:clan AA aspartic protease (TIGR02281 family)